MKKTYISLFSSAGVGCYGFKLEGFECIATNELIERRLQVQRFNKKCKYDTGYICGDITKKEIQQLLYAEILKWHKLEHIKEVDVVIATPPCQGMSVANLKKHIDEIIRNSLVVESIKIIKKVRPRFFIFENVPAFAKTICTDTDGSNKTIYDAIMCNLGNEYEFISQVINFKNYGACSSRSRTLVIGVRKDLNMDVSPSELYPNICKEKTLRSTIGHLKPLKEIGEIDSTDIYHAFRKYPEYMRKWISDLKEGESAFDNADDEKKPHQIVDGKIIINQRKNGDKYKRQYWDKVGPCIHTRNDQLASQNTIHPSDDRVFSIRELMLMMTIPSSFKWSEFELNELNSLPLNEKVKYLKKEEIKIRQSIGEAVPTVIFQGIAQKISAVMESKKLSFSQINELLKKIGGNSESLIKYIERNEENYSFATLCKIAELGNSKRREEAAYFTDKCIMAKIVSMLPEINKQQIRILEPSCGVGNFIPFIIDKYSNKEVIIDMIDIDEYSLKIAAILLNKIYIPDNIKINLICDDFLLHKFDEKYDLIIGNPPFIKIKATEKKLKVYKKQAINKDTTNICSFFMDKAISIANHVAFIFPKFLLNTPEFKVTRETLEKMSVETILDFGEYGFKGVLIETIGIIIDSTRLPNITKVYSYNDNLTIIQKQKYIFDKKLPYWIIYRDNVFDEVSSKMKFGIFDVFRDRQITKKMLNATNGIRVLKSRNINVDGSGIIDIPNYDSYIDEITAKSLGVNSYLDMDGLYLVPNMTYYPRMIEKPKGMLVNGSIAILIPKYGTILNKKQMQYIASNEFRTFYNIARNKQTRSLNIDINSVYFFGMLLED